MNYKDIDTFLEEGEGFQIEFKRKVSTPEKIARTLIGFANTKGGTIIFGVDDDKSIVGVDSEKSEVEMIRTAGGFSCDPPVEMKIDIIAYKRKDVIAVTVEESRVKPHYLVGSDNGSGDEDSKVLIRVKDKTVVASKEVIRILESENPDARPLRIAIGDAERRLLDYLDVSERITVKEFSKLVNISRRRASRALIQLVRAGVLRIHTSEREEFYTLAFDQ
jgi:predicted HTH transcriptional regulator